MIPINLNTAELAISELLSLSTMLTKLGIMYETQKPILDLAESIYVREVLPEVLANERTERTEAFQ